MRDIADGLAAWLAADLRFAVATVVQTWHSAPRQPGASMAVAENGDVLGSVSGGCVEGAVYDLAQEVLASGHAVLRTYGVSDDDALEVGLTCGGIVEIFVQPADAEHFPELPAVLDAVRSGRPTAVASVITGPVSAGPHLVITADDSTGTLGHIGLDTGVLQHARGLLTLGHTAVVHIGPHGEQRMDSLGVFVQTFAAPARMLVFGAIDFASAVARIGKFLGYHVTVCDARPVFATRKRFPDVDELVVKWPHQFLDQITVDETTVICVLTHDPKFDVPLLERALLTRARYIGAMGSRRTHADRLRRLREVGVSEGAIGRLSSPIGLDLGARTPEETAVAIAAEIIALRWGGSGQPLTTTGMAIHRPAAEPPDGDMVRACAVASAGDGGANNGDTGNGDTDNRPVGARVEEDQMADDVSSADVAADPDPGDAAPLRDPAHERGGPTIDDAVATAERGTQVEGVHTPSGQAASGESRLEQMPEVEGVDGPRVDGDPSESVGPPRPGPGPAEIGAGGAQRIVGARISDRVAAGEAVAAGPPFDTDPAGTPPDASGAGT